MNKTTVACSLLLTFFLAGCGGGSKGPVTYSVSGTVTFDGEPVKKGDIKFVPEEPGAAPDAGSIVDGKYSLSAKGGKKKVQITASRDVPGKTTKGAMGEDIAVKEEFIPARYNSQTELTADVTGAKTFDFKLTTAK